jgi:hypothetical protein
MLVLLAFNIRDNQVSWTISNGTGQEYRLFGLAPTWRDGNPVTDVLLGGEPWLNEAEVAALQNSQSPEVFGDARTKLAPGATQPIAIRYKFAPVPQSAGLSMEFAFESPTSQCLLKSEW